jgi:hypothetical protein
MVDGAEAARCAGVSPSAAAAELGPVLICCEGLSPPTTKGGASCAALRHFRHPIRITDPDRPISIRDPDRQILIAVRA